MIQIIDIYLASALLSYGAELVDIDRTDERRQRFCFDEGVEFIWVLDGPVVIRMENPTIQEIEMKFASDRLLFPPSYPAAVRKMKSAIYSSAYANE